MRAHGLRPGPKRRCATDATNEENSVGVQEIADKIKSRVASAGFDRSVKFDTGSDGVIVIDGATVSTTDAPTDCTIKLSLDDLDSLIAGDLEPDHGVHDRQDQGRGRHDGRHGAQPAARLIRFRRNDNAASIGRRCAFVANRGGSAQQVATCLRLRACGRKPSACRARHRARRPPVPAPAGGAAHRVPAWPASRSCRPRSRSVRNRAHRRPAGWRA